MIADITIMFALQSLQKFLNNKRKSSDDELIKKNDEVHEMKKQADVAAIKSQRISKRAKDQRDGIRGHGGDYKTNEKRSHHKVSHNIQQPMK